MRRRKLKGMRFLLGVVATASLASCVKREPLKIPAIKSTCVRTVLANDASGLRDRALAPDTWFSMILANYDPLRKKSIGRPRHCDGKPVRVAPFPKARKCKKRPFLSNMEVKDSDKLTMARLVREPLNEQEELVWLQTHVDENQDALGPLVRVEWGKNSVSVHPMGTLAAHRNAVHLRVVGRTHPVLAVESDRCADRRKSDCARELRVRVWVDGTFENLPMVSENKQCLGEFKLRMQESRIVKSRSGHVEQHVVSRDLQDIAPDGLVIAEEADTQGGGGTKPTLLSTESFHRPVIVRDDHVLVAAGIIEEIDRLTPTPKRKKDPAKATR